MRKTSEAISNSIKKRMLETMPEQMDSFTKIREGRPMEAEYDFERKLAFIQKQVDVNDEVATRIASYENPETLPVVEAVKKKAELIQGATIDFMGIHFLDLAKAASRSVGRVIFKDERPQGSGFMISPFLFITNNHVIPTKEDAKQFLLQFNYEQDYRLVKQESSLFELSPDLFFKTAPEDDLDFTVVAIGKKVSGKLDIGDFGYIPLFESGNKHIKGIFVNCIQHPEGNFKQLVVRENRLLARTDQTLIYSSDTMPGSSGSPVFNDDWEVIAIHHWGEPYKALLNQPDGLPNNGNEGIRISAIVGYLKNLTDYTITEKKLIEEALAFSFRQPSLIIQLPDKSESEKKLTVISDTKSDMALIKDNKIETNMNPPITGQVSFTVPLTITVQLGTPLGNAPAAPAPIDTATPVSLEGAEKFEPDPNYGSRRGYNQNFLGIKIPMPKLTPLQRKNAARNLKAKNDEDNKEFKYQHFSVFMNASRRLAYFTAVNIDGSSVININRQTGKVTRAESAEGREKWFNDDRIDSGEICEDKLYTDVPKMENFQRGHLVKRTDPSWGTETKARKGQADTFHFTNCAPQHFNFNPKKNRWAGIEDWITNTSDDENIRVSVFTGPVFEDNDPQLGYIQIPKAYWKIVVWLEDGELRATGVLADQCKLLKQSGIDIGESLSRKESLDQLPDKLPAEYHCSIKYLEEITELSFGDLSKYDSFNKAEAIDGSKYKRISDYEDFIKR